MRLKNLTGIIMNHLEQLSQRIEELEEEKNAIHQMLRMTADNMKLTQNLLETSNKRLEHQNKYINDSINYAARIQRAFLQNTQRTHEIIQDLFILDYPKDVLSGDFYWLHEAPNYTYIAVSDCTGHGVPGALLTVLGISQLNKIAEQTEEPSPSKVLTRLHKQMQHFTSNKQNQLCISDGMDIGLCIWDKREKALRFSGAKRPLLTYKNNTLTYIRGGRCSIGDVDFDDKKLSDVTLKDCEESTFYLFTDGYPDQFGKNDKKLKLAPFRRIIEKHAHKPLFEQQAALSSELHEWKGNTTQTDDILMLGFNTSTL